MSGRDSVICALSLDDVQRNSDRMVVKEIFVDCETLTGKQFTVDIVLCFILLPSLFCLVMCVVSMCGFVLQLRGWSVL